MPIAYWLCAISAILWIFTGWFAAKSKSDYLHPAVFFSIIFAISYPLKLLISFHGFHTMDSMSVNQSVILWSIFIFNAAGICFIFPLLLLRKVETSHLIFRHVSFSPSITLFISVLLLIISHGIDAFSSIFSIEGLQGRISERANERVGAGLISLLGSVGLFLLISFSIKYIKNSNSIYKFLPVIVVYSFFALLLTGSKYNGLLFPFIFFIVLYYSYRVHGKSMINFKGLILGCMVGLCLVALFGYIRGAGAWSDEYTYPFFLQSFFQLINAFDAPDNLIVLLDRAETWAIGGIGLRLWGDYILFPFIPRFIWPEKPLVQGNQLVMEGYFSERFSGHLGEAISPSFPGEMILTGGLLYMVIWLMILGFLTSRLYLHAQTKGGLYFIAYVWLVLNVFNFMRSGTGIVGSFLLFMATMLLTYLFLHIIYIIMKKSSKNSIVKANKDKSVDSMTLH